MFCNNCGNEMGDRAVSCPSCEQPTSNAYVPNYLVQAILVTICCCLPFGIPAIVYAAQVNVKLASGDFVGAKSSADAAKMWCWIAFGTGVVVGILSFTVQMLGISQQGGF